MKRTVFRLTSLGVQKINIEDDTVTGVSPFKEITVLEQEVKEKEKPLVQYFRVSKVKFNSPPKPIPNGKTVSNGELTIDVGEVETIQDLIELEKERTASPFVLTEIYEDLGVLL